MNRKSWSSEEKTGIVMELLRGEEKLKAVMFAWIQKQEVWLRDHHVRLGRHWNELVRRTLR